MRLLILFPSWIPGGADRTYIAPVLPEALHRGWEVHTACSSRRALHPLIAQLQQQGAIHHACEIAEWHCTGLTYRVQQALFYRRTRRLLCAVRPDRVLLVLPWVSYGIGAMRACRDEAIPTAAVFQLVRHEPLPGWRIGATRELLAEFCHPVAVSDNNRSILCDMFAMQPDSITLIYNGTCVTPRHPESQHGAIREQVRRELGVRDCDLVLLTTARLSRQKGHKYLIEAAPHVLARHAGARFMFAGEGPARHEYEKLIARRRLAEHIRMLGERSDVEELSLAADLFVFPTTFEGSPFALMEAMAYGLPIVTTNASGIPEIIRHEQDGIVVEKESPNALRDGILRAASNLRRMQEMASSALKQVREFSAERMAAQTLNLLETIQPKAER